MRLTPAKMTTQRYSNVMPRFIDSLHSYIILHGKLVTGFDIDIVLVK
jgi:hypothetical protein